MQNDRIDDLYDGDDIFGETFIDINDGDADIFGKTFIDTNDDKNVNTYTHVDLKTEKIDSEYNEIKLELVSEEVKKELKRQIRPCINGKIITECTFSERNGKLTLLLIPKNFSLTLNTNDGKKTFNNIHSFTTDENKNITITCEQIKRYFKPTREFFKNGKNIKSSFTKKNNKLVMSIKPKYKNKYCSNIQNKIQTKNFINKYNNCVKNIQI